MDNKISFQKLIFPGAQEGLKLDPKMIQRFQQQSSRSEYGHIIDFLDPKYDIAIFKSKSIELSPKHIELKTMVVPHNPNNETMSLTDLMEKDITKSRNYPYMAPDDRNMVHYFLRVTYERLLDVLLS